MGKIVKGDEWVAGKTGISAFGPDAEFPHVSFVCSNAGADVIADQSQAMSKMQFEVPIVALTIRTVDLRAFKQDFEWDSYPVYAANRYASAINLNLSDVWHRELEKEEESGDFVSSL